MPITLLEAMQAGVPLVATTVGEIPKVLDGGRYGRLVSPGDSEKLANAITAVFVNREEAKAKALAAQEMVLKEYSVERMADQYIEVYTNLICKR